MSRPASEPVHGWEALPHGYLRCTHCGRSIARAFVTYVSGWLRSWRPVPCKCQGETR